MQLAPIPFDEAQRLDALRRLLILDSEPEERFDRITRIAHHLFDIPFAFITLVDDSRVWFKSAYGCDMKEEGRDLSICGHAICNSVTEDISSRLFEVHDTEKDDRFSDNTFVTEKCGIRYYLGFVLQSADHRNIGTLCIVDSCPRTFTATEVNLFLDLGFMVEAELNNNRHAFKMGVSNFVSHGGNDNSIAGQQTDKVQNLSVALEAVYKQFGKSQENHNIDYGEWRILNEIVQTEFATPHSICEKLGISPSLITSKLDALEIKRLIERWESKDGDRRFVHLACTKQGNNVWDMGIDDINQLSEIHLKDIICLK